MSKYVCTVCGYEYNPKNGDPENGVPAGTGFNDIAENWICPICGVPKSYFEKKERQASNRK